MGGELALHDWHDRRGPRQGKYLEPRDTTAMRLLITTPTAVVIDDPNVVAVRAEDESGGFGILSGHADFLTALTISVVSWHRADNRQRFCAVRRGVLSMTSGNEVAIATREAVPDDDLDHLEQVVLKEFEAAEADRIARTEACNCRRKPSGRSSATCGRKGRAYSETDCEHQARRARTRRAGRLGRRGQDTTQTPALVERRRAVRCAVRRPDRRSAGSLSRQR